MVFLDFDQKKNVLNSILHENEKKNLKVIFSQFSSGISYNHNFVNNYIRARVHLFEICRNFYHYYPTLAKILFVMDKKRANTLAKS